MDSKLKFITKELIVEAAREIDKNGIPEKRKGRAYLVNVNGENYPMKLLITGASEIAGEKILTKEFSSNESNRKGFEEKTGFKIDNKYQSKNTFSEIIEKLKANLKNDNSILREFHFKKTYSDYVLVEDNKGIIGTKNVHYEIRMIGGNIYVELHFESNNKEERDIFNNSIHLSQYEEFKWFNWHNSKSIRAKKYIDINSESVINSLKEKLLNMENSLGDEVRYIIKGQGDKFYEELKKFESMDIDVYFDFLKEIILHFNLKRGDKRLVYSCYGGRLNFTVGHRYSWNLYKNEKRGKFGVISEEKIIDSAEKYDGKEPLPYYNYVMDANFTQDQKKSIFNSIENELKRVSKSAFHKNSQQDFEDYLFDKIIGNREAENKLPLNQILYGPPGTGKTYHTINKAIEIINPGFDLKQDRKTVKDEYERLVEAGQIVFTTFHQSMSYEDFVEGIKPLEPENEGDNVNYKVVDGIFKKICIKATEKHEINNFEDVYKSFIDEVISKETFELSTLTHKKPFNLRVNGSGNCVAIPKTEAATEMVITKKMIHDYLLDETIIDWKPYLTSIVAYLKENYNLSVANVDNIGKPYVLIIDEINRGNVSSIFGELITLIEEDKRIDATEELKVVLPYSKDEKSKFGVPRNLHIIGTMNTADRSVEALDTALRRRFSFVEMPPKPEIIGQENENEGKIDLGGYEVNLANLLETINNRIEILLDRDHLIGHSYFIGVNDKKSLIRAFSKQIIPLLQEYFYGDYGKISLVLGEGFCKGKKTRDISNIFAKTGEYDIDVFLEKIIYKLYDPLQMENDGFKKAIEKLGIEETNLSNSEDR